MRDGHPYEGKSLWWLTTYERLLVLAMLENHGLTLPPETQALRGFGRRGQTSWRWKALADTRTALRKQKLLRWVMPWLWPRSSVQGRFWSVAKAQRNVGTNRASDLGPAAPIPPRKSSMALRSFGRRG